MNGGFSGENPLHMVVWMRNPGVNWKSSIHVGLSGKSSTTGRFVNWGGKSGGFDGEIIFQWWNFQLAMID